MDNSEVSTVDTNYLKIDRWRNNVWICLRPRHIGSSSLAIQCEHFI